MLTKSGYCDNIKKVVIKLDKEFMNSYVFLRKERNQVFKYETSIFLLDIIYGYCTERYIKNFEYSQPTHRHSYYELHIVTEGICTFESEGKNILTVSKNEMILFPPKSKHKIISESDKFSKISITFSMVIKEIDSPNFYKIAEENAQVPAVHKINTQIKNLINTMSENAKQKQHEYINIIYLSTISLLIEILRKIVGKTKIISTKKSSDTRVINAVEYIKSNISASLNVDDVANHLHISTKQLVRIFKKEMDTTPGAYIKNHRIKCITDLIHDDLYIEDIASLMGYSDSASLIKAYKRSTGTTPSKYKKSIAQKI